MLRKLPQLFIGRRHKVYGGQEGLFYGNRGRTHHASDAARNQYQQAIEACDRKIRRNPRDALAYNQRGSFYGTLGQYERAIEELSNAVRLDPTLAGAYSERGMAYINLAHYDQAISDYDESIRLKADFAVAYNNRGHALYWMMSYDRALYDLNQAISLSAEWVLPYANRSLVHTVLHKDIEADRDLDNVFEHDAKYPHSVSSHYDHVTLRRVIEDLKNWR